MFEQLKKAVEKHYNEEAKKQIYFVKNGFCKEWSEEHRNKSDNGIRRNLTALAWEKFTSGKITRAEAVERATKKALADVEKRKQKDIAKIDRAEKAKDIDSVNISVEWKSNRIWRVNPTASICVIGCGYYTGTASGYGYDKQSTAISNAFNSSPELLKVLYMAEERRLKSKQKKSRREFIGYGSSYETSTPLPYFEGGCGVSCYNKIFAACGFDFENVANGQTFNAYTIRKTPKTKRA